MENSPLAHIEWCVSDDYVSYPEAINFMEQRVADIRNGKASEMVWLLEHPPLYTAGTSATPDEILDPERFPIYQSGRGGKHTYHGPGQRVAYVMLDLKKHGQDIRAFVHNLEEWIIQTLAQFNLKGERRDSRIGIWINRGGREDKIGAIGVRVRRWVSFHGISLNVEPDLSHFEGIIPCGITEHGVTSLWDMGLTPTMAEVDVLLQEAFEEVFRREGVLTPPPTGELTTKECE